MRELEAQRNKTEDDLYEVSNETSGLRKEFKTIGNIINKIVNETLSIDLSNEYGENIPRSKRTGEYELNEDNLL